MSFAMSSIAMQGAGVAMSTVGAYNAAQGQQISLNGQASLSDINAQMAEFSAESSIYAGQRKQQSVLLQGAQLKSTQRASMAANGIDLGSQTATNILTSTDVMKEIDSNTIAANALREAWGYRTQAVNQTNDALIKRATANGISPSMAAMTTMISGAGKVASSWYSMNKSGAFGGGSNPYAGNADGTNLTSGTSGMAD